MTVAAPAVLTAGLVGSLLATGGKCDASHDPTRPHWTTEEEAQYKYLKSLSFTMGAVLTAPGASYLCRYASTHYLHRVARCALLVWFQQWAAAATDTCACVLGHSFASADGPAPLLLTLVVLRFQLLLLNRLQVLEARALKDLGVRCLELHLRAVAFSCTALAVIYLAVRDELRAWCSIAAWVAISSYSIAAVLASRVLLRVRRAALEATRVSLKRNHIMDTEAVKAVRFQMLGVIVGMLSTAICMGTTLWMDRVLLPVPSMSPEDQSPLDLVLVAILPTVFDGILNLVATLLWSGALTGALSKGAEDQRVREARKRLWESFSDSWQPHEDARWQATVEELAERGITLEALLRFYSGLGQDYMPHFDPDRHTTMDVVRGAIIPLSADARSAMAPVLMNGVPTRPRVMVTHWWGNLFRDLVASVVADALGEDEYEKVAYLLQNECELLESWVSRSNVGGLTYWICAFSVNQHASICGANPEGARDSVTKDLYPVCSCGLPKFLNDTPPTLSDGRGVSCEMNKFSTMMQFLSSQDKHFTQMVAIDASFGIFQRAWCVAEIATANAIGMQQRLKLRSSDTLRRHCLMLAKLKVEEMEASRPEDKAEILALIGDTDAFDKRIQQVLHGELLPSWRGLDAKDQMLRLAHVVRWEPVNKRFALWQTGEDIPKEVTNDSLSG